MPTRSVTTVLVVSATGAGGASSVRVTVTVGRGAVVEVTVTVAAGTTELAVTEDAEVVVRLASPHPARATDATNAARERRAGLFGRAMSDILPVSGTP